ncbi:MAG: ABC transporter ATP-binding protein [Euryarchaeota archaeon]|nr:ABC transporter ATP-binding protein [Euryarchaeota archaeon]MCG2738419.1 ABC transporter ATP-binding protein [Candidatus Methanoperedenaceae archaeon]
MMVETKDLTKYYSPGKEKVVALEGVNLTIEEGEFIALVGPSGSGKSTLLYILGCIDAPSRGEVYLDSTKVEFKNSSSLVLLRRKLIGFVFQTFNLMPAMTAVQNIEYPMYFNKTPGIKRRERATMLLESVGLGNRNSHLPSELSGGEQQRVAIARALANDPVLILADEPTGNLDSKTGKTILGMMKRLNKEEGKTVIMVTHDPDVAHTADRAIRILDGRIQ